MVDLVKGLALAATALVASVLAAVTGFGGAALLLPVLSLTVGVRAAVPVLTVAQLVGNVSRVWLNRREVRWEVVGWFALGGIPSAVVGALIFAVAPLSGLKQGLGFFLLGLVLWRRFHPKTMPRPGVRGFAAIGAASGLLSAVFGTVGPLMAPLFLAHGLVKGAYIGTEAMATVVMHAVKLVAYGRLAVLTPEVVGVGLVLAPFMILGSWVGKRIVDRLPEQVFLGLIEATLSLAGVLLAFGVI